VSEGQQEQSENQQEPHGSSHNVQNDVDDDSKLANNSQLKQLFDAIE